MSKSFVCFIMAACKEKEQSGTFQSVLNTLLTQINLPSIVMEGNTPPSLDSLLGSLNSGKLIDNIGEDSTDELSYEVLDESAGDIDGSANNSWGHIGSGKSAKKISKKQIVIFRRRSSPKRITENNVMQLLWERKIAVSSPFNINQTIQRLREDIGICKVDEVSNNVFKECLEIMRIEVNDLLTSLSNSHIILLIASIFML